MPLTGEAHRQRHVELHAALDELLADYVRHHPAQHEFLTLPLRVYLEWSYRQTITPDEDSTDEGH
jgi:hypothetical protein